MSTDEQIRYHAQRAEHEREQGLAARSPAAARAHMELSSLHLQRMRALRGREDAGPALFLLEN